MYRTADDILARMETSGCRKLFEESVSKGSVVHGDYNYHNLIMLRDDIAVTDFEHMHTDIQIKDFCYFLRKAWKKINGNKNQDKNYWKHMKKYVLCRKGRKSLRR